MTRPEESCRDLHYFFKRVKEKAADYEAYRFSRQQNDILKTFFDLAQEFESLEDFYRICVVVPSAYLDLQVRLYLLDVNTNKLQLVCDSLNGLYSKPQKPPVYLKLARTAYSHEESYLVPICRKHHSSAEAPALSLQNRLLGVLEISPRQGLDEDDYFFFGKLTNRIAYNLYNRRLVQQNIRHLAFINNLVMDIEHNVIIPNMYFRHLFRQLRKSLGRFEELLDDLSMPSTDAVVDLEARKRLHELRDELTECYRHLLDHHANTSLFLESLFRRDHFTQGHLVLKTRPCKIEAEIIRPQLDNYLSRFELYGIEVARQGGREEEVCLAVDIGLLAQVYANLFSNAIKYTAEIVRKDGSKRKALVYGSEFCLDCFGPGKSGIKFNVFTTGPHLFENERARMFEDGFRGLNSAKSSGTGHGLSFVKQVIEIHGGRVGCELVEDGNNLFFVLPLPPPGHDH